jgi:thymidylate synthase (FAD)
MKIINPSIEFVDQCDPITKLKNIELAGRVCYKSEGKITENSYENFIRSIIDRGHESVLEHEKVTIKIICDRGVSHEIVRHRIASYSQESTRYCNYSNEKFEKEITVIKPLFWNEDSQNYLIWKQTLTEIESKYFSLIENGATPQEARSILPNSLKTEIFVTMNFREWRHFLILRLSPASHPQMREIAQMIYNKFSQHYNILVENINHETK